MMMEKLVEWRLEEETEVLRGNLPRRHFVHLRGHAQSWQTKYIYRGLLARSFREFSGKTEGKSSSIISEDDQFSGRDWNQALSSYKPEKNIAATSLH
jgi:hypothetical protein